MIDPIRFNYRFQLQNFIGAALRAHEIPTPSAVDTWARLVAIRSLDVDLLVQEVRACLGDMRPALAPRYGLRGPDVEAWLAATAAVRAVDPRWAAPDITDGDPVPGPVGSGAPPATDAVAADVTGDTSGAAVPRARATGR